MCAWNLFRCWKNNDKNMTYDEKGGLRMTREEYEKLMKDCSTIQEYCRLLRESMFYGYPGAGKKIAS